MKKLFLSLLCLLSIMSVKAADTILVKSPQIPILIERHDNVLFYMRLNANESKVLDNVTVNFGKDVNLNNIKSLKLYYSGTEALQDRGKGRFAPVEYISSHNPGKTLSANPSYSVMKPKLQK